MYLVPFSLQSIHWQDPHFWLGLVFVTFPLNFLVYGLNDFTNGKANSLNPRKGNYLYGANLTKIAQKNLPWHICLVDIPFLGYFFYVGGADLFVLVLFMFVVNILYNYKPFRLKERPPLDILLQLGYVFVALFSILLNNPEMMPWQSFVALSILAFSAHLVGEIIDMESDTLANKKTTALFLGRKNSKLLLILLLVLETYLFWDWFRAWVVAGITGFSSLWLLFDVLLFYKARPYSQKHIMIFGICINLLAYATLFWVLYSGSLLHPNF